MAEPAGNGTIPGAVARVSQSLINALPPGYLILVILNIVVIGCLIWFLDDQLEQRNKMAEQLFHRCLEVALKDVP
jgi:hypothetical protein